MSPRRAKVPRAPRAPLSQTSDDLITLTEALWRIHPTQGAHAPRWNQLRTYGPVEHMRWDPHPPVEHMGWDPYPPVVPSEHPDHGVLYAALDLTTALAEVFQTTRVIDTNASAPHLTAWKPTRPLMLLDLVNSQWALRNGAAAALTAADRSVCRFWAREIHAQLPTVDGLLVPSTMTGRPAVVLWSRASDSFPSAPGFSRPLAYPLVWSIARAAAAEIGYGITG